MPFYEYECSKCGYRDEVLQKISDSPLKKCPACGKSALKKLMSAPVFRLKGSGWYETDFKSDKDKQRNLAGAERDEQKADAKPAEGDAANKSTEAKGDTKSEPKSEPKAEAAASKESKPVAPSKKAAKRPLPKSKRRARK
jgi:putative FmdB family regulatory protein